MPYVNCANYGAGLPVTVFMHPDTARLDSWHIAIRIDRVCRSSWLLLLQRLVAVAMAAQSLMPGVTPRLTGHNARNAPGILG